MLANIVFAIAAVAVVGIEAQSSTYPSDATVTSSPTTTVWSVATPTSSRGPKTTTIGVGASGFKFSPNNVTAQPGDTVEFLFYPDGHWVIRAEFGYPCIPYETVDIGRTGFSSGPQPVKVIIPSEQPRFRVLVNDTNPIFFYCGAPGSCFKEKMVGAINPNPTQSLERQLEIARDVDFQLLPGEPFPTESGYATPTPGGIQTTTPTASPARDDHSHLSAGAIAGIAIGSAAVLVLAAGLIYLCGRRGGIDKAYRKSTASYQFAPPPVVEAQYKPGHKSPGMEQWNSQYAGMVPHEAYRDQSSPPLPYGPRSPPISPQNVPGYGGYAPNIASPLMSSVDGGTVQYYQGPTPPPPMAAQVQQAPLVELPTSGDPGNSPLPNYAPARHFSWGGSQEANYRPSSKS